MLVAVSSYSLVTTIPRLIAVGMNSVNGRFVYFGQYWFYFWGMFIVAPWNYCGNFFMYVLSGKEFREELALMFCCRERPSGAFHSLLRYNYEAAHYITFLVHSAYSKSEKLGLCITEFQKQRITQNENITLK